MKITDIRIFPKESRDKKLKAYATVTFDGCFVIHNIKVIQGTSALFIAMPSRKAKYPCSRCRAKVESGFRFCPQCGTAIDARSTGIIDDVKNEHRDIAHPVTQEFRDYVQNEILKAHREEEDKIAAGLVRPSAYSEDD